MSIARIHATQRRASEERLHERHTQRIHRVALLLAHHVAHAFVATSDERKALRVAQTLFHLHFAFLRQAQITRFDLIRSRTRRRAKRSRTTRGDHEFGKSRGVRPVTGAHAIGHVGRARLHASDEAETLGFVRAIAIRQLALFVQTIAARIAGFRARRGASAHAAHTSHAPGGDHSARTAHAAHAACAAFSAFTAAARCRRCSGARGRYGIDARGAAPAEDECRASHHECHGENELEVCHDRG